jgi:hypothetical protein
MLKPLISNVICNMKHNPQNAEHQLLASFMQPFKLSSAAIFGNLTRHLTSAHKG